MTYIEYIPEGYLSRYIDKFWYCQANNLTNITLTIPLLHHELVINFSDSYYLSYDSKFDDAIKKPMAWISGIQTKPFFTKNEGYHEMMGVLFKPNGLNVFVKANLSEFKNDFFDATMIFNNSFRILLDQIQNTKNPKGKLNLIKKYLIDNYDSDNAPQYLRSSIQLLKIHPDNRVLVKEVCNQLSISNKSLIKSFKKHVGVTPIRFSQLHQINKALYYLSNDPEQSYTKLAYKLHFYDQSHFINSFKSVTNMTPSQYSKYILANNASTQFPNFISIRG